MAENEERPSRPKEKNLTDGRTQIIIRRDIDPEVKMKKADPTIIVPKRPGLSLRSTR